MLSVFMVTVTGKQSYRYFVTPLRNLLLFIVTWEGCVTFEKE
jgi:hypothetical protein